MEHRQRRPCHAGTLPAGTVAPGSVPAPAARHRNGGQTTTAHDMHRDAPGAADRTASADRRPEQQRTTRRRPGLFLLPIFHALPPARPAGSAARHALGVVPPRGKAGKYPGSAGRSTRILRPPPAPGRISTASAAPMTPQPISCTACPLPTASSQQRQTSQQPAPAARHRNGGQTTTAHDMHRDAPGAADRTASADRRPEQQRTTRRRRRGQILYLTDISTLQYSRKLG